MNSIEPERLIKVENQDGLFRDTANNSILFKPNDHQESRKKSFIDILKRIKNIENTLEILSNRLSGLEK